MNHKLNMVIAVVNWENLVPIIGTTLVVVFGAWNRLAVRNAKAGRKRIFLLVNGKHSRALKKNVDTALTVLAQARRLADITKLPEDVAAAVSAATALAVATIEHRDHDAAQERVDNLSEGAGPK